MKLLFEQAELYISFIIYMVSIGKCENVNKLYTRFDKLSVRASAQARLFFAEKRCEYWQGIRG